MTQSDIRVRFAPSPTGYLHVGGARTALFNWLYARQSHGKFLLRIEDTDRARSSEAHVQVILDGLEWLGLDFDEAIVFQGAGIERHRSLADQLLREGHAYEEDGAIWFRMPEQDIVWDDAVYERISFRGDDIKNWVILRSDRTPTYNFTVVADDLEMRITHVMRGDDHISNTPKQIAVYCALGHEPPVFVHLPMIHGPDGRKLSKRHGATAVGDYRTKGILPEAMRNFLALLGWNPGDEQELFPSPSDLIDAFSIDRVQKKSAIFDLTKLEWLNGQYISRTPPRALYELVQSDLQAKGLDIPAIGTDRVLRAIEVQSERARTTLELAHRVAIRYDATLIERDAKANKLIAKNLDGFRAALHHAAQRLEAIDTSEWLPDRLEAELRDVAEEQGLAAGALFQPIRVALTGQAVSEPVNVLLEVVGKDESLKRIERAREWTAA
ncbi:MAG: glutamate--tRNA ligase [Gemmatimonadota bacterium]|nr:glutamate--tRNA ligase [Gemmatimonadota bacterium]